MDNIYLAVARQHFHFELDDPSSPQHVTPEEKAFRVKAFLEETQEYEDAKTLEEHLDALVDLVIFALGAANRHGFHRFNEALHRVVDANMKKERGPNAKRGGYQLDLVKPPGWKPADLSDLAEPKEGAK